MFNFEDKFQCVSKHWFDDSAAINHCQRYSRFTDDTLMCIQCKEGFALIESSNTCVSFEDCSGTVVIGRQDENYEFSIFDEKYVICDTAQDKNVCAIKAVGNSMILYYHIKYFIYKLPLLNIFFYFLIICVFKKKINNFRQNRRLRVHWLFHHTLPHR
jgi:hypothetical protein